jgi:thioredoxin-related protein
LVLALFGFTSLASVQALDFDDGKLSHLSYPDWFKESFLDLREDLAEARAEGKLGLMVLFATEGCSYCAEFIRRSLGDERLASRVRSRFDAIGLEIFSDLEMVGPHGTPLRVKSFAEREGAEFAPTLVFYGDDGNLLYRGVGYHSPERFARVLDYLTGGHYLNTSFRDFTAAEQPTASDAETTSYRLRPDPLFEVPPYALDRSRVPAQRPLLVIFETDGCGACAQLHDQVLARPEVRELLRRFDLVRLDAQDNETPVLTPDGTPTTPGDWYASMEFTRVPALSFFDQGGKEVLHTDALVLRQRMLNSLLYTLERAYEKQWTYQRFARSKALEHLRQ